MVCVVPAKCNLSCHYRIKYLNGITTTLSLIKQCVLRDFSTNVTILCIQILASPYIPHHNQPYFIICRSPVYFLHLEYAPIWFRFVSSEYSADASMRYMQNHKFVIAPSWFDLPNKSVVFSRCRIHFTPNASKSYTLRNSSHKKCSHFLFYQRVRLNLLARGWVYFFLLVCLTSAKSLASFSRLFHTSVRLTNQILIVNAPVFFTALHIFIHTYWWCNKCGVSTNEVETHQRNVFSMSMNWIVKRMYCVIWSVRMYHVKM